MSILECVTRTTRTTTTTTTFQLIDRDARGEKRYRENVRIYHKISFRILPDRNTESTGLSICTNFVRKL